MIEKIKEWLNKWAIIERKSYEDLLNKLSEIDSKLNDFIILKNELEGEIALLKDDLENVDDENYWNNKWERNDVYYKAPEKIKVIEYVKYRQIKKISDIANQIIDSYSLTDDNYNSCLLLVMKWIKKSDFKYIKEIKEYWDKPEDFLKNNGGDCDGFGIFMYFIAREIFMKLKVWEKVRHRLKCVCGNVNKRGDIPSGNGGHFYLLWLHDDLEWYTIETTYYLANAIFNFKRLSQKLNQMYGTIWFTFNESFSWAQHSIVITKKDFEKK